MLDTSLNRLDSISTRFPHLFHLSLLHLTMSPLPTSWRCLVSLFLIIPIYFLLYPSGSQILLLGLTSSKVCCSGLYQEASALACPPPAQLVLIFGSTGHSLSLLASFQLLDIAHTYMNCDSHLEFGRASTMPLGIKWGNRKGWFIVAI